MNKKRGKNLREVVAAQSEKIDPGNVLLIMYMIFAVLLVIGGGIRAAHAEEQGAVVAGSAGMNMNEIERGELLVPLPGGGYSPLPILDQNVHIEITGLVARAKVTQTFENPSDKWLEAEYAFPLPEDSAVDSLKMLIGERRVVGQIKEKTEARKIYQQAKREGKKASLLVQKRPNIFVTSVANIAPGEQIVIDIEYQQRVQYENNVFSLRFPMTITPRYTPSGEGQRDGSPSSSSPLSFTDDGWADTVEYHWKEQFGIQIPENLMNMQIVLNSKLQLAGVKSLYHGIVDRQEENRHTIHLDGKVKMDRDFVLEWRVADSDKVQAAAYTELKNGKEYHMVMLMPPVVKPVYLPREMIFVIDTSGSMSGASIRQAKKSLINGLSYLRQRDTFNIIEFNNEATRMFMTPQPADKKHIQAAEHFVSRLRADGGTEMAKALSMALSGQGSSERIRQVVFITDGAVSNERELFSMIRENLGSTRLFTVGIGSAPNSYFMTRAARAGRGTHTYIGQSDEIVLKMGTLFKKISAPVITDISINSADADKNGIEMYPSRIPDLYMGEPLVVTLKTDKESNNKLKINGRSGKTSWAYDADLDGAKNSEGIVQLWAREKIKQDMEGLVFGENEDSVRKKVLKTALDYSLVSKYTSLVAVDEVSARKEADPLFSGKVKNHLPNGFQIPVQSQQLYGGSSQTATPAELFFFLSMCCMSAALLLVLCNRKRQGAW